MSKSNTTETDFLAYTFNATAFSWTAATVLTVHLHTADPGEAGVVTTSECNYTNYVGGTSGGVDVNRNSGGWTVSGSTASNAALIQFPQCGASGNTITHVSVSPKGSSQILYSGALSAPLTVSNLVQPQFAIGSLTISEE
jgi:hypothetical protein